MRTSDLDFDLPRRLIATAPAEPRDSSRLLVVSRSDPGRLEHRVFTDLPGLLGAGDTVVFNHTRVVQARLEGENLGTGGRVEALYLYDEPGEPDEGGVAGVGGGADGRMRWVVLIKARRARVGARVGLVRASGERTGVVIELLERRADAGAGAWLVAVDPGGHGPSGTAALLEAVGRTPLPPYILGARRERGEQTGDGFDRAWYQTVFAGDDAGSVAAPTAGLHFTPRVLDALDARGVDRRAVVLHVGAGTFRPVEASRLEDHAMHAERCHLGTAAGLLSSRRRGGEGAGETGRMGEMERAGRVFAVGSTSARTLEAAAGLADDPAWAERTRDAGGWFETDILIAPGHRWRVVDGLVTNFHLPRSTLLAMVAAALEAPGVDGVERVHRVYAAAIADGYRFYSYGDAMVVLP